ncbi:CHY zinc finger protein [Salimicrobium flavidum]|uniref:Uncharacterized protein, contains Zn-finger domain of CHY type n=1 Tax=Salimicrobium flavidum TaxID=570947 RepID=A0A1N7JII1_9BACI|nr:CHY zinc finger protein [Salimicrobium flavidum]SIS49137.1 Uncharacterized protein, contains Zn-finger domain of CHY type [Salimicrobium flavidum]
MNVKGIEMDDKTRCRHYHSAEDVVAIRFYCCGEYYACIKCHEELAGHEVEVWPIEEQETRGIFCGNCQEELLITLYKARSQCPNCNHNFNPGCKAHFPYYFE